MKIFCNNCNVEFDAEMWEASECPICNREYRWIEDYSPDYTTTWEYVEWI